MHDTFGDTLVDIVQNSIEAGATMVTLDLIHEDGKLGVMIGDNGKGMSEETRKRVLDPFYTDGKKHASRKIGMGLPFLKQMVELANGKFDLQSEEGVGTSIFFDFELQHPDAPSMEDLPGALVSTLMFDAEYELRIYRKTPKGSYAVNRSELIDALGEIQSTSSIRLAKEYFESQEGGSKNYPNLKNHS